VDILVELNSNFSNIVTARLDQRSKEALETQQDPATMTDIETVKIRKAISNLVYGNALSIKFIFPGFCL
jgi:hypothetical protein